MKQITGYKDSTHLVEDVSGFGSTIEDGPTSGARLSKASGEKPVEEPASVEESGSGALERGSTDSPVVVAGEVSTEVEQPRAEASLAPQGTGKKVLTVRELEMMGRMEEIGNLEEIAVGGTTNIEPEVIGTIAGVAVRSVEGVATLGTTSLRRTIRERMGASERRSRGVEVEVGSREAILDINIRVIYGYSIPVTVVKVRHVVADRLLNLCGLVAKEINVKITGLEFPERMPGRVQ